MATTHLTDLELARLALDGEDHPHLEGCDACAAGLRELVELIGTLEALPDPPPRLIEAATEFYRRRRRLEGLLERLTEDVALRAKARTSPERVLRDAGIEPIPELVAALREQGRNSTDAARRIAAKHLWL